MKKLKATFCLAFFLASCVIPGNNAWEQSKFEAIEDYFRLEYSIPYRIEFARKGSFYRGNFYFENVYRSGPFSKKTMLLQLKCYIGSDGNLIDWRVSGLSKIERFWDSAGESSIITKYENLSEAEAFFLLKNPQNRTI